MDILKEGSILEGPLWPEKVRVISVSPLGNKVKLETVGTATQNYQSVILAPEDLAKIRVIQGLSLDFTGDALGHFLTIEAHRIRNAYQFDPLFAVSVSQVDPLPHQIEAVYHYILRNPRIRFLLADDPGAGKTIMAGLLIKELKYRGLVDRILIVVPGHLKDQWIREMKEKFQEAFRVVDRALINASWGQNVWKEENQVITSLDFARQEDVKESLKEAQWDLVIVDEAHKLSAYKYGDKVKKTLRYVLGELLSNTTKFLLFLTATPHRGDPENFRLFLDLLEPGFFADVQMLNEATANRDNPLFLRRLKEDLKNFDGTPLFPPRKVETIKYQMSSEERVLYNEVTDYVQEHFNKALQKDKRNVAFALTVLQRRLASSIRAVRKSLERRKKRLEDLLEKGEIIQEQGYIDEEAFEDLPEKERWKKEEELLEKLSSAETLEELREEVQRLSELVTLARQVEKLETETKLNELKKLMDAEGLKGSDIKLLVFTEFRDTMDYLVEKLKSWGYSVTCIHGGMSLDARIKAEGDFRHETQIMVATEAAGEGINLQFCWLMVNYDIPWNPNRLEQRMGRVHRYGQEHEVHVYNMVAVDTREGRILDKLFEKLSKMKEHLGSDRVFDVIGDVLPGKSLKDLIMEAIANPVTLDDILASFDRIPEEEAIEKVKEATLEALATRHLDLSKIFREQQRARENRLVPEYIEAFFKKAADYLGIRMEKRQDGFWRIRNIPWEVRNQSHSFKIKFGEVRHEYLKVSFDKDQARKGNAEFVAMGHPLMEAVIETIFKTFTQGMGKGAVFVDPEGTMEGFLWFLLGEIQDGKREVAGRRLFCVHQEKGGEFHYLSPSVLWDLKPHQAQDNLEPLEPMNRDEITSYLFDTGLESYRQELLENRQRDAEIKRKYGLRSLDALILKSVEKLTDYATRKAKGEVIPDAVIQNEERNKEELLKKKKRLEEEIRAETNLTVVEPKLLGVVRVIKEKEGVQESMRSDKEIERIGMEVAMAYERQNGRVPEDVSALNLGYDIRSMAPDGSCRYIEVKARAGEGAIALTPNEWFMARRMGDDYWLYVVENAATDSPQLYTIQNPAARYSPEEILGAVRYVIKDWKMVVQTPTPLKGER